MTTTLKVRCPDIVCEGCATAIKRSLGGVAGVQNIEVGVENKDVTVEYDATQTSESTQPLIGLAASWSNATAGSLPSPN
jgi:copper chaperone CopZ